MIKRQRSKQIAMAAIAVTLSLFCYCAFGSLTLKNYENDPNLARGMQYDLGESGVDYDKAISEGPGVRPSGSFVCDRI